jgi:hypothetical protein
MSPIAGVVQAVLSNSGLATLEISVDEDQRAAVQRLLGFLQSGKDAPRARPPRYRAALPVFVSSREGSTYMNTFSVSRGGCGVTWIGTRPKVGSMLELRFGSGKATASFRAMVCWARDHKSGQRVGLRFVAGEEGPWISLLKAARIQAA